MPSHHEPLPPRREREFRTIAALILRYCADHHATGPRLCEECDALTDYAHKRLQRCPYGEEKPTCAHCPIHCYQPRIREQIREVMRYAGPRLLFRHPVLALRHWWDGRRPAPPLPHRRPRADPS